MNISVADPPKQCCLLPNETIVEDIVIVRHSINAKDSNLFKRPMTHQFWRNVNYSTLTMNCGIILLGKKLFTLY